MNTQILIILAIGAVGGMLSGLLGIGGAVAIIPALIYFLGFNQSMAQGTTLLMFSMPIGAAAAFQYYKAGNVDVKTSLILASAFVVSAFFSAKFANEIPQATLKKAFGILLLLLSIKMLFIDKAVK